MKKSSYNVHNAEIEQGKSYLLLLASAAVLVIVTSFALKHLAGV